MILLRRFCCYISCWYYTLSLLKQQSHLTDAKYILKHGLSDNESISGVAGENIDVRGFNIFDHETLILNEAVGTGDAAFKVKLPDGTTTATSIVNRFPLGSYIQIGGEIMRIASSFIIWWRWR